MAGGRRQDDPINALRRWAWDGMMGCPTADAIRARERSWGEADHLWAAQGFDQLELQTQPNAIDKAALRLKSALKGRWPVVRRYALRGRGIASTQVDARPKALQRRLPVARRGWPSCPPPALIHATRPAATMCRMSAWQLMCRRGWLHWADTLTNEEGHETSLYSG